MYSFQGDFREVKPHIVNPCSFCLLVKQIGKDNLNSRDKLTITRHIKIAHSLKPYYIDA